MESGVVLFVWGCFLEGAGGVGGAGVLVGVCVFVYLCVSVSVHDSHLFSFLCCG